MHAGGLWMLRWEMPGVVTLCEVGQPLHGDSALRHIFVAFVLDRLLRFCEDLCSRFCALLAFIAVAGAVEGREVHPCVGPVVTTCQYRTVYRLS